MSRSKLFLSVFVTVVLISSNTYALPSEFRLENRSNREYNGPASVVIPFARGEITNVNNLTLRADGVAGRLTPFKYHIFGTERSVALARLDVPVQIGASQSKVFQLSQGGTPAPGFRLSPSIMALPTLGEHLLIRVLMDGRECFAAPMYDPFELLESTSVGATFKLRSRPRCFGGGTAPISITTYLSFSSNTQGIVEFAKLAILVGDDVLNETPANGRRATVQLLTKSPAVSALFKPNAHGGLRQLPSIYGYSAIELLNEASHTIYDGMKVPFLVGLAVGPESSSAVQSMRAAVENHTFGLQGFVPMSPWQQSLALGPQKYFPSPRFSNVADGRQALESLCSEQLNFSPVGYKGEVMQAPNSTGDQKDIVLVSPVTVQQVAQTQSSCPMNRLTIAAYSEFLRPTARDFWYFNQALGREVQVTTATIPDHFVWSGRTHYSSSQNPSGGLYDLLTLRRGDGLLKTSAYGSYLPALGLHDEEHVYDSTVIGYAELTGDPVILDLLRSITRLRYFEYLTGRFNSLGASRAFGRMGQSILHLTRFFATEPEMIQIRRRFIDKVVQVARPSLTNAIQTYGYAVTENSSDARVSQAGLCLSGQAPLFPPPLNTEGNCTADVVWQDGFFLTALSMLQADGEGGTAASSMMADILNAVSRKFLAIGTPKTNMLIRDPNFFQTGAIGLSWFSGWSLAALTLPLHYNSNFLTQNFATNQLVPNIEGSDVVNQFWRTRDCWKLY